MTKSRRKRWERRAARMVEKRNAYRVLVGKSEEKRLLGRPRRRWERIILSRDLVTIEGFWLVTGFTEPLQIRDYK
jgi:hypothetical protein